MRSLSLGCDNSSSLTVLCLGAHSDDIEIGCGGTILRLARQYPNCKFRWVVFSAIGVRETEARCGAEVFAGPATLTEVQLRNFPDGFMPFVGEKIKKVFEELKGGVSPDLIFSPYLKDAHQDHRLIAELTRNTFRNHLILEYEIPKYDGDMGQPTVFVPLEFEMCKQKVRYLMNTFKSQHSKPWFEESTFLSLLRLRGMECNSPSGYGEAFYCRKVVL
jgi:LmbE family N-acetylglucosaminyl deacetylase